MRAHRSKRITRAVSTSSCRVPRVSQRVISCRRSDLQASLCLPNNWRHVQCRGYPLSGYRITDTTRRKVVLNICILDLSSAMFTTGHVTTCALKEDETGTITVWFAWTKYNNAISGVQSRAKLFRDPKYTYILSDRKLLCSRNVFFECPFGCVRFSNFFLPLYSPNRKNPLWVHFAHFEVFDEHEQRTTKIK